MENHTRDSGGQSSKSRSLKSYNDGTANLRPVPGKRSVSYNEETAKEQNVVPAKVKYRFNPVKNSSGSSYKEETAGEIAAPVRVNLNRNDQGLYSGGREEGDSQEAGGRMLGFSALGLSILSLFILPVLLGAAGIILGFLAVRRGASGTGGWAIGIGAVSLIIGVFITPFF